MQHTLVLPLAFVAMVVAGLVYANTNSTNTSLHAGLNTVQTQAVTCTTNAVALSVGNSLKCGNWTVTFSNVSEENEDGANESVAMFSVFTSTNATNKVLLRTLEIEHNGTRTVCMHENDVGIVGTENESAETHDCLTIKTSDLNLKAGTAMVDLQGITRTGGHKHEHEHEELSASEHANVHAELSGSQNSGEDTRESANAQVYENENDRK